MLTVADYFCGAGGSSSGAELVPGVRVVMAANHWELAVQTHASNFPHADHDRADISGINPRRHPRTDVAWFSPECTHWSVSRGVKQTYDGRPEQLGLFGEDDEPLPDEAAQRSRMLMQDVPRFTEIHRYRGVIVENVTDILKWEHLDVWLGRMAKMGYAHRIVVLNSAFAVALGPAAPQLRDRVYFVFWRSEYREPDFAKWTRPRAYCPRCDQDVNAVQVIKPGKRRALRYGRQYDYRCPHACCRGAAVQPYALPAAAAIDWTIEGARIGDRVTPLRPKTLARIESGLRRHARPVLAPAGGTWNESAQPVTEPMRTRTTRETEGIACPPNTPVEPLLLPVEARVGKLARPVGLPMRSQTTRAENALVIPLRNNGVAKLAAAEPLLTFAAAGTHQGLVMRNNSVRGDSGYLSTPVTEPLRTVTTAGHQSLIRWQDAIMPYDGRGFRPVRLPLPTQTTVQGNALVGPDIAVEDCTFRMLEVAEIHRGMAFLDDYQLPYGSKRDRVKMLGNAVTPPAARDLIAALVEAITGDEIEPASLGDDLFTELDDAQTHRGALGGSLSNESAT